MEPVPFEVKRRWMIRTQLVRRGIRDPSVIRAMREVPRHRFVPKEYETRAYDDRPIPIGAGQTISQPYMVALMTEQLSVRPGAKVLEVGTGSGYQAAILSVLGAKVYSIERIPELAVSAQKRLSELGYGNVIVRCGDGSLGWPQEAPFDGIVLTAYVPKLPDPLIQQLADGGRIVAPVGEAMEQWLVVGTYREGRLETKTVCGCLFVPLIGSEGVQ